MKAKVISRPFPLLTADELGLVQRSKGIFDRHTDKKGRLALQINHGKKTESFLLPAPVCRLLEEILSQMAQGNTVAVLPREAEIRTQEAADFLNVSRPYLIGLLDGGKIPCRKVGTHRRIRVKDVLDYRKALEAERNRALGELVKQAQELKMGY